MARRPRKLYPFLKHSLAMKTSLAVVWRWRRLLQSTSPEMTRLWIMNQIVRVSGNDKLPPTSIILLNAASEEDCDVDDSKKPEGV